MDFMDVVFEGTAGGLLCIWKTNRSRLWVSLAHLRANFDKPWCLVGDFNEIRPLGERRGCSRKDKGMRDFNQFIENLELTDPPMMGRQFAWCNSNDGRRWSRIDRVLMSSKWVERFNFKLWGLERSLSDNYPPKLMEDGRDWGLRPFRFINAWSLHPQFQEFVKKSWNDSDISGWAGYVIMKKLKSLRFAFKKWNSDVFGNVTMALQVVVKELHGIDLVVELRNLNEEESRRRREVRNEVWSLSRREEWLWLQKSRMNWHMKGDKNTRFFHVVATSRQNRNMLNSFEVNGVIHVEPPRLGSDQDFTRLITPFSEGEIWRAVKESDDYRPISLIGPLYKILSKVLANRLKNILPRIVGEAQSAFMGGKNILDGVLISNEIIDWWKKRKRGG
ncbi:uncharacterized protein LOC114295342 [Camellia sinensis]|uniref:uncharacterized protein LOC114295342 n=1 Tax=Camellia sinensis TaxID=4442 RepID=UPI001036660E|nr:uncharacterized protein LOC114295342 [Camellia sinensis]